MTKKTKASINDKIQSITTTYLTNRYKRENPDFDKSRIQAIIESIREFAKNDALLEDIAGLLRSKNKFDLDYLIKVVETVLSPDILEQIFAQCTFNPVSIHRNNSDELKNLLTEFINNETQEEEQRTHVAEDFNLRRLDSLSRLLSFGIQNSACTAVTIYQGQLIISANVGGRTSSEEMTKLVYKKVAALQTLIQQCPVDQYNDILAYCQETNRTKALSDILGTGVTLDALQVSLAKIIHLYKSHHDPFAEQFRLALNPEQPITVLMPKKDQAKLTIQVTKSNSSDRASIVLDQVDNAATEKDLHAEQMIFHYLTKEQQLPLDTASLCVGISKLCCHTCFSVLTSHPSFTVRGTHKNRYAGAVNVITGTREEHNSPYHGPSHPFSSHVFSPMNSCNQNVRQSGTESNGADLSIQLSNLIGEFASQRVSPAVEVETPAELPPIKLNIDLEHWALLKTDLILKRDHLQSRNKTKAALATSRLIEALQACVDTAHGSSMTEQRVTQQFKEALHEAHQELDNHRGWWHRTLKRIVAIFLAPDSPKQPRFFSRPTHSKMILDEIELQLPQMIMAG